MILLANHSVTKVRKIPIESHSLTLTERSSTASIVPADMTGIEVGSWMMDDTNPGSGIVWRAISVSTAYHTETPTIQLEHIINTLRDRIMFGEHKAGTAVEAINMILGFQSDWVLGGCDYVVSNPYKFDGETLFDALETVSNSLTDSYWEYDTTVYPFRLYIRRKSAAVGTRMRAGRNLRTISRKIDRSPMYTRFYPIGKDDLHLSTNCVEKNTTIYDVVEKVETDTSIDNESELLRWATERLDMHAQPVVTIDVEGIELADATGESLDKMVLGAVCEIPLPEYNTTISERITSLSYQDKVHSPELVKIQLSNARADTRRITDIIASAIKNGSSGRGGRTGAKQQKEDHAWFEDTNQHVSMCAIGIIGVDAQGKPNWTRMSTLEVNENGIYGEVKSVQNDVTISKTRIEQTENSIGQFVEAVGADGKITAASIKMAINGDKSSIKLSADQISLSGDTTINDIFSVSGGRIIARKPIQFGVNGEYAYIGSSGVMTPALNLQSSSGQGVTLKAGDVQEMITKAKVENGKLYLYPKNNPSKPITFSRATTLSGRWSGDERGTVAEFQCQTDDASIPGLSTWITLSSSGTTVYAKDHEGNTRASLDTGGSGYTYTLFGRFTRYGTVSVEGETYMAYITKDTSASASNLALYRRN